MRRFLAILLSLCMLVAVFAACDGGNDTQKETTGGAVGDTTEEKDTDKTENTTSNGNDTESNTEKNNDTEKGTEDETDEPVINVDPALPEGEADLSYVTDDGYVMSQYNGKQKTDYLAACAYYEKEGYELYSSTELGTAISSTFISGNAYTVVMLNANKSELYIGVSESGAENFPADSSDYFELNATTVTQHGSEMENGMGYIFKLADGSFIIFDGGHYEDTDSSYELLCRLNGSSYGIHIRAWFITHAHGDHFRMFSQFAKDYADKVTLDTLYYCAVVDEPNRDPYLNTSVKVDLAQFEGAKSLQVHTGMAFDFVDVNVQILCSPDQVYKNVETDDFNETSVVYRVKNEGGSMIVNGDIGVNGCNFMIGCYGEALKSDMVQMAHHGLETSTSEYYDLIAPSTVFIPYGSSLSGGGRAKQNVLQSEYAKEILVHGYGHITRELSHKAEKSETISLMPLTAGMVKPNKFVKDFAINDQGYMTYDVIGSGEGLDVQLWYSAKKLDWDTTKYNAVKIVIDSFPIENQEGLYNGGCEFFYTSGNDNVGTFSTEKSFSMFQQGFSTNDTFVMIAYLGDLPGFTGEEITSIRIDVGSTPGQHVVIRSIEAFHVEIDAE